MEPEFSGQLWRNFQWLRNRIYRKDNDIHEDLLAYDDERKWSEKSRIGKA